MTKGLFYSRQSKPDQQIYRQLLLGSAGAGCLYSNNEKPFIHYRAAERVFCKAFSAIDVSRQDVSVDAVKTRDGIGIKTFLSGGIPKYEKIAEFDNRLKYPLDLTDKNKLISQVASYRNQRLADTSSRFNIGDLLYHYIVRDVRKIIICECPMFLINEKKIKITSARGNSVNFHDSVFLYRFDISKSTLFKGFDTSGPLDVINVPARIDDRLILEAIHAVDEQFQAGEKAEIKFKDYVVLPLYSTRTHQVPEKSGLNQWNAGGRRRDDDEIYIPIPRLVHRKKPDFFPPRDTKFSLATSDGKEFIAKVCQEGEKALMSDPNKSLGKWLLRDKLGLQYGQLLKLDYLRNKGLDTVIVYKIADGKYRIETHLLDAFDKEYDEGAKEAQSTLPYENGKSDLFFSDVIFDGKYEDGCLPVYDLQAVATTFGEQATPSVKGWKPMKGRKCGSDMFIAQVVGKSMETTIPDGSWCLFRFEHGGSRNGLIVLVESRLVTDPETQQSFTIKRYHSEKQDLGGGQWKHKRIVLSPDNKAFKDIVLENVAEDDFRVVAEFIAVI